MRLGFVQCNDAKINFELYENGKEFLLFLHGNSENMKYFEKQKEFFMDNYSILLIDSRGHGESEFGNQKLTLDLMAEDIYYVLNYLRIPRITVIGFSDGANLAMMLAYKHHERIERLVLVGGNMNPSGLKLSFWFPTFVSYLLCSLAAKLDNKSAINRDMLAIMVKEPNITKEDLKKITAKTLVMAGENDMIKLSHTENIAKFIKNSKLKIIDNADHFIIYKMPDLFNKILSEFLNEKK